ncbi:Purine permease [Thalictrum thalictroides]|uniref:Probable purine permease n=1 Tax=Thalictrum thalictroides TaxID=46969 RepID=A0A7J6VJE8_THATH|nr:Purine permease [Thalictrum thalictroides]
MKESSSTSYGQQSISELKIPFIISMSNNNNLYENEEGKEQKPKQNQNPNSRKTINWPLLLLSCAFVAIGVIGGPLLSRLYYLHGGNLQWLISCMETVGFPILFLPLIFLFLQSKSKNVSFSLFIMEPKLFISSALIGILLGLDTYLYSLGISYTPVSTSSILYSTQLAFLAFFSLVIVKQKFTVFSINSVILMSIGSILLGLRTNGDRPPGVSNAQYWLGFFLTLASAALLGLIWPLVEISYTMAKRPVNYSIVLQYQINLAIFATIFSIAGMIINKDFQAISREAKEYGLGNGMYYTVLVAGAVVWQLSFIGGLGVIYCMNSLLNGILSAVLLPITEIVAVIAYHENFTGEKALALVLCLWGFTSYFYGEYKVNKKLKKTNIVKVDEPSDA